LGAAIPVLAFGLGCTEGPGRDPFYADAAVVRDATPMDLGFFDSGQFRDAGPEDVPVTVADGGLLPDAPFTGVFGILNSSSSLFAREVDGRLQLIVDDFPYTYVGTITPDGVVNTQSPELTRSGCLVATISGTYDRQGAVFNLEHRTCNAQNDPLSSTMTGGFVENYLPQYSGVYSVDARVVADLQGCYDAPGPVIPATFALSVVASGRTFFFAVDDLVEGNAVAFGTTTSQGAFQLMQHTSAGGNGRTFVLSGTLSRLTVSDPWIVELDRGVWDPVEDCPFTIEATGTRIAFP
jgi:hypothetical protein